MQTDAKTFAYMFQYPICNLCVVSLLYFIVYQRLTKFMTSTSLSALKGRMTKVIRFFVCNQSVSSGLSDLQIPESEIAA